MLCICRKSSHDIGMNKPDHWHVIHDVPLYAAQWGELKELAGAIICGHLSQLLEARLYLVEGIGAHMHAAARSRCSHTHGVPEMMIWKGNSIPK